MNPNDASRDAILRHLYAVHEKARSPRSAAVKISELQKALRPSGLKQQDVGRNLDYLVQKGWVREDVITRTFMTRRGTTQSADQVTYKISDVGIDRLESASVYERSATAQEINVVTIGGVSVVGDRNTIVNTSYTELDRVLEQLRAAALEEPALSETDRLTVVADLDALRSQLQKPEPNREVVRALWSGVEATVTIGSLAELAAHVAHLLAPLLS